MQLYNISCNKMHVEPIVVNNKLWEVYRFIQQKE